MNDVNVIQQQHGYNIGDVCPNVKPNVKESCYFMQDGVRIGAFVKEIPIELKHLLSLANSELISDRVPKSTLNRRSSDGVNEETGKFKYRNQVDQYSVIIGSVPPKPHMKRPYPQISSVHQTKTANLFIRSMLLLCVKAELFVKELLPDLYENQKKEFERVDEKWKFGNLFTSSISNCNSAAPFHVDSKNIKNTFNLIFVKRQKSTGGNIYLPDYDACIDQTDNSLLIYPAWRNIHGVTPIEPTRKDGYRNSLVFYPLKAFQNQI